MTTEAQRLGLLGYTVARPAGEGWRVELAQGLATPDEAGHRAAAEMVDCLAPGYRVVAVHLADDERTIW